MYSPGTRTTKLVALGCPSLDIPARTSEATCGVSPETDLTPRTLWLQRTLTISSRVFLVKTLTNSNMLFVEDVVGRRGRRRVSFCAERRSHCRARPIFHTRILKSVSLRWTQNRDLAPHLPAGEVTRDRGVWGASQWKVPQTGPLHAVALSEMPLQISQPTLRLSKTDRHKLVFDVQTHHVSRHLKSNDLAVIGCTDAAEGDRVDGSSTGGYVMTMAPYGPFNEGHMTDTSLV